MSWTAMFCHEIVADVSQPSAYGAYSFTADYDCYVAQSQRVIMVELIFKLDVDAELCTVIQLTDGIGMC